MVLGDGFVLQHVASGWELARERAPTLPEKPPKMGYCLSWHGIWIAVVGLFNTDAHWMIAEYLVVTEDPYVPPKTRQAGLKRMLPAMVAFAVANGKQLVFMNSSPGVRVLLKNQGILEDHGLELLMMDRRHL